MNEIQPQDIHTLITWYNTNKRAFPWRDTGNPYHVWVSEIMLQQTRIEAVIDKYQAFMQALPTIFDLANCPDDSLMLLWEGLGYYSRARNLKKCAMILVEEYDGQLPNTYDELIALPGIGAYTAGAIASICFEERVPAIDGNVLRVFARLFHYKEDIRSTKTKMYFENKLIPILEMEEFNNQASLINQGLMELGETICIPNGMPKCDQCPFKDSCQTNKTKDYTEIPYRSPLKKRKIINRTLFIIRDGDKFLIHKRNSQGLLANLYEFIGVDTHCNQKECLEYLKQYPIQPLSIHALPESKHIFTHLEWHMKAYEITVEEIDIPLGDDYIIATKKELQNYALPSAFKTYVDWYMLRD